MFPFGLRTGFQFTLAGLIILAINLACYWLIISCIVSGMKRYGGCNETMKVEKYVMGDLFCPEGK